MENPTRIMLGVALVAVVLLLCGFRFSRPFSPALATDPEQPIDLTLGESASLSNAPEGPAYLSATAQTQFPPPLMAMLPLASMKLSGA